MTSTATDPQAGQARTPPSSVVRIATLEERDRAIAHEIHLLREDMVRLEHRLWILATTGVGAGALGGAAVALVQQLGGL